MFVDYAVDSVEISLGVNNETAVILFAA